MNKLFDPQAFDRLIKRCHEAMDGLEMALSYQHIDTAKTCLSQTETLRDALESRSMPADLSKGARFLEIKGLLDKAIADGFVQLNLHSTNMYGLFNGGDAVSAEVRENVHVDEIETLNKNFSTE